MKASVINFKLSSGKKVSEDFGVSIARHDEILKYLEDLLGNFKHEMESTDGDFYFEEVAFKIFFEADFEYNNYEELMVAWREYCLKIEHIKQYLRSFQDFL